MIALLGSRGMLGSMIAKTLDLDFTTFDRPELDATSMQGYHKLYNFDRVVNAIGLIKPYCGDVANAIKVNALFPYTLPENTIQIATDCVYWGSKGDYVETDSHDATDTYGKTKSLGEADHLNNLRCSIIGPEVKNHLSLLDWFLAQEDTVNGFTNHYWNGITTLAFAHIIQGIIRNNLELPSLQHIVPADKVTKAELLEIIAQVYNKDIIIRPVEAPQSIDRTLSTNNSELNHKIWQSAGYNKPPTIKEMIEEMSQF